MDILTAALAPQLAGKGDAKLSLTLPTPLPPALAKQPAGQPVSVTVGTTSPKGTELKLPDGTSITVRLSPALPAGSQLQLTLPPNLATLPGTPQFDVADVILGQPKPEGTPAQPANPGTTPGASPNPASGQPAQAATLTLPPAAIKLISLPATAASAAAPQAAPGQNLPLTTAQTVTGTQAPAKTAQATTSPPGLPTLTITQVSATNTPSGTSPTPSLATGPVQLLSGTPNQPLPTLPNVAVTAKITAPMAADGTQSIQFTPPGHNTPVTLRLNLGQNLPTGTQITLQPFVNAGKPSLTAMLLSPVPLATSQPTAPQLQTLHLTPQKGAEIQPFQGIQPARVLPVQNGQQQVLLPSGQTLNLTSQNPLPAGTVLMVKSSATAGFSIVTTPTAASAQAVPTAQSQVLEGTITDDGTLHISTPGPFHNKELPLNLAHNLPTTPLPPGTHIRLQLTGDNQATLLSTLLPQNFTTSQTLSTFTQGWSNLQTLMQTLPAILPNLAQTLAAHLPQLAAFSPGFLGFFDAVQSNSASRAFGPDTVAFARAMGLDLSADIQQLNQLQQPQQNAPEAWRGLIFPYQEAPGAQPQQGTFFWRRQQQKDEENQDNKPSSLRFVVELSLTAFGPLQLDGLLNYPQLWLKLRLQRPTASPEMAEELRTLVAQTLENIGLQGGLALEVTPTFPVDPAAERLATAPTPRGTLA